ncbi:acidic mammalian chitinase-like [Physella acuta]|uniref:acidic mammalian chitinase-like n=1 Tax=Physella acuta TaxID=109671 RepID=UPI0027DE9A93|nr:acidic mammalian chitinase-like [Physella acuta]
MSKTTNMSTWTFKQMVSAVFVFSACIQNVAVGKNVVCYFNNLAQHRPGSGALFARDINPDLCSHVIFAHAQLSGNIVLRSQENDDTTDGQWRQLTSLKNRNPSLKTLLSVGGMTQGPAPFYTMSSSKNNRLEFINTTILLLRNFGFDGLDIDWEYPGDISPLDKPFFTALIKELRDALDSEVFSSGQPRLLLSAAVPSAIDKASLGFNVTALDTYLDIINIMTYDYHGPWEAETGLATPLHYGDGLDVATTVDWYKQNGASTTKIHVGLSFFARTWTLSDSSSTHVGAAANGGGTSGTYTSGGGTSGTYTSGGGTSGTYTSGGGTSGTYTSEPGVLAYYEVCSLIGAGYTVKTDPVGQVKYAYLANQWMTYEDRDTLNVKLEWIQRNNLGGAVAWALDMDDFSNQFCNHGNWPLLSQVSSKLSSPTTSNPTSTTPSPTAIRTSSAARDTGATTVSTTTTDNSAVTKITNVLLLSLLLALPSLVLNLMQ